MLHLSSLTPYYFLSLHANDPTHHIQTQRPGTAGLELLEFADRIRRIGKLPVTAIEVHPQLRRTRSLALSAEQRRLSILRIQVEAFQVVGLDRRPLVNGVTAILL